jgi:starch phosphorylase
MSKRLYQRLIDLSQNLWWSWQAKGPVLWQMLNAHLWESTFHNPVMMLAKLGREGVETAWHAQLDQILNTLESDWFKYNQSRDPVAQKIPNIAYFSAEFGLHESLATYSGGLGILAGDHLKSASDLGIPLTAVGLLYRQGYVQQQIDDHGQQHAHFLHYGFYEYPIEACRSQNGEEIVVSVQIFDQICHCKLWTLQVGRIQLILLDTDIDQNPHELRSITSRLYGGDHHLRIQQEIVLGIAGVRALRALKLNIQAYHLNEGHSSFLSLERLREYIQQGYSFETALPLVKRNALFTTHTPVEAGHDRFDADLTMSALAWMANDLGLDRNRFLNLGHWSDETDANALFNMTFLAFHTCSKFNGVAKLHGEVSRQMFARFWHTTVDQTPIGHVTNGVHAQTWQATEIRSLVENQLYQHVLEDIRHPQKLNPIYQIDDAKLWQHKRQLKQKLIHLARHREKQRRERLGLAAFEDSFDLDAFTIGFARRFATYKRADLIFSQIDRLIQILEKVPGKVQILFSGKAHPADHGGQNLIKSVYQASQHPLLKGKILLIEDYDMEVGRAMVQGCDIWLNNPRRPKEASGTSGMKAAMNGTLNVSILDGWWPEGWIKDVNGWAIGQEKDYDSVELQDAEDAESLYHCLENEVLPLYFQRNQDHLPTEWIKRMKGSIVTCTPTFHMHRQVIDYCEQYYQKLNTSV